MTSPEPTPRRLTRPVLIIVVALVCVAALIGVVIREDHARSHGTEVTLSMQGVDPRDLVRGHYVGVRLVEQMPPGQTCAAGGGKWIALRPNGPRWYPVGQFGNQQEAQRHGDIAVRGTLQCVGQTAHLHLGIDRFYINQSDATTIERAVVSGVEAAAIVSVGADGRARLVGIDVDGKRYDLNW